MRVFILLCFFVEGVTEERYLAENSRLSEMEKPAPPSYRVTQVGGGIMMTRTVQTPPTVSATLAAFAAFTASRNTDNSVEFKKNASPIPEITSERDGGPLVERLEKFIHKNKLSGVSAFLCYQDGYLAEVWYDPEISESENTLGLIKRNFPNDAILYVPDQSGQYSLGPPSGFDDLDGLALLSDPVAVSERYPHLDPNLVIWAQAPGYDACVITGEIRHSLAAQLTGELPGIDVAVLDGPVDDTEFENALDLADRPVVIIVPDADQPKPWLASLVAAMVARPNRTTRLILLAETLGDWINLIMTGVLSPKVFPFTGMRVESVFHGESSGDVEKTNVTSSPDIILPKVLPVGDPEKDVSTRGPPASKMKAAITSENMIHLIFLLVETSNDAASDSGYSSLRSNRTRQPRAQQTGSYVVTADLLSEVLRVFLAPKVAQLLGATTEMVLNGDENDRLAAEALDDLTKYLGEFNPTGLSEDNLSESLQFSLWLSRQFRVGVSEDAGHIYEPGNQNDKKALQNEDGRNLGLHYNHIVLTVLLCLQNGVLATVKSSFADLLVKRRYTNRENVAGIFERAQQIRSWNIRRTGTSIDPSNSSTPFAFTNPNRDRVSAWIASQADNHYESSVKYDVFMSYNSADSLIVREIAGLIDSAGLRLSFSEASGDLEGEGLSLNTEAVIEQSSMFVFFISRHALTTDWLDVEVAACIRQSQRKTRARYLVVRLDNSEIPFSLANFDFIDCRERKYDQIIEKITADVSTVALTAEITRSHESREKQYASAKVLLVGDSSAGKTGLAMRLAQETWRPTDSTVGAWSTRWSLGNTADARGDEEREIWLWDFGGQYDQRLVHQLFMDDTELAVLVFDGQRDGALDSLRQWVRDIARAAQAGCRKLLVAGRVDGGAPRVGRDDMEQFAKDNGFDGYFETSAKTGFGCRELKEAIIRGIDWDKIRWRSSLANFKTLKDAVFYLKDTAINMHVESGKISGEVLLRFPELCDAIRAHVHPATFKDDELKAVLSLLSGPGVVRELKFGQYYLLLPELISSYLQGLLRQDRLQYGYVKESDFFSGDLPEEVPRLADVIKDRLLLLELHHMMLERALCYREVTKDIGVILIFPTRFVMDPPKLKWQPPVIVSYTFNGYVDEAYATLVVRLHHTQSFRDATLFRDYASFETSSGQVGVKVKRLIDQVEFEVFREPVVADDTVIEFCAFVYQHLLQFDQDVKRFRHFTCANCGSSIANREAVMFKIKKFFDATNAGLRVERPSAICALCDRPVLVWDNIEDYYSRSNFHGRVRDLQEYSKSRLQRQSADRILIADVMSLVLQAGHEVEELPVLELGAGLKVTLRPDGTTVMVVLSTHESLVISSLNERLFDGDVLQFAPEWAARNLRVVLVIRIENTSRAGDDEIQWSPLSGVRVVNQRAEFRGLRLDLEAVRSWIAMPTGTSVITPSAPEVVLADAAPSLLWTQRDRRNDVFISFRASEPFGSGTVRTALIRPLVTALSPLAVFDDESALEEMMASTPGTTIDGIFQGLLCTQGGGAVAVLITPTYLERMWVSLELAVAVSLHDAGQVRLLPFLLGGLVASNLSAHPFVRHVCPSLMNVLMFRVPNETSALSFIKSKIEKTLSLQKDVAGNTAAASFAVLLNRISEILEGEPISRNKLVNYLLGRPLNDDETLHDAFVRDERITPADVSLLHNAILSSIKTSLRQPLLQLVQCYQFKWHQTSSSIAIADIGAVKARVAQWWASSYNKY